MIYITGDTHGEFGRVEAFCERFQTKREDILIILGDAGINFSRGMRDGLKKRFLEELPITLFCIHGNHEQRPITIDTYKEMNWRGGTVYYEEEYPHLLFAKAGEVFDFDRKKTIVIGGAYSVDKMVRLMCGYGWWQDEQPSTESWLDEIEDKLDYGKWYCGHYHTEKKIEKMEIMFENFDIFCRNDIGIT